MTFQTITKPQILYIKKTASNSFDVVKALM